jgi:hypothetical protein
MTRPHPPPDVSGHGEHTPSVRWVALSPSRVVQAGRPASTSLLAASPVPDMWAVVLEAVARPKEAIQGRGAGRWWPGRVGSHVLG